MKVYMSYPQYREVEISEGESNYREVELPNEAFELSWTTYNDLRTRICELELALDAAQDTIGDIRTKWMALREKYGMKDELIEDIL